MLPVVFADHHRSPRPVTIAMRASVLTAVLSMLLVMAPAPASAAIYDDVGPTHVFLDEIELLASTRVTRGCGAGPRFCPDRPVTRGEMAAFLTRMLDLPRTRSDFRDTRGHLFDRDIGALARAGITAGCNRDGTRFCPDRSVSRAEMATFLERALDLPAAPERFTDVPSGSTHAAGIGALAASGITRGCDPGATRFCPNDPVTRGQMAAFLTRSMRRLDTDAQLWMLSLPQVNQVGRRTTVNVPSNAWFGLQTTSSRSGFTVNGGKSAAVYADGDGIVISDALIGGAPDGVKAGDETTIRDSVLSVQRLPDAHMDHVQINNDDNVRLENLRMVAHSPGGGPDASWNAAIFAHAGASGTVVRNVLIEAGNRGTRLTTWFPVRFETGTARVNGLIVDRAVLRQGGKPVLVVDDATLLEWEDVYIRELDGSLTPVPRP